ncbi:MAG: hypothetical protein H8E66_23025 [Planctomycetes bacterium]|nr:hypothetical protein [Planctomycetota bacterium]
MPIRVVCKHCGKQFSAWDDLVGKAVKCPKCQQEMVLHSGNEALGETPAPTRSTAPAAPGSAPTQPVAPPMPKVPAQPPASAGGSSQPHSTDDFDESEDLPYACPHCHQSMKADEDLCDKCGYHRVLKRRIDITEGVNKPDKSVGFERFFKGQLTDANSAESTLLMMKVVGGLFALAFVFVCHPWSWLIVIGGVVAFVFYKKNRAGKTGDADPSAVNQDAASSLLWTLTLNFQRAVGWRLPALPFPTTKALTLHDSTFSDQDLGGVDDLSTYETLDLEGTQLSNAGLEQLEKMKQLRYVVVRRTNVTATGVQRLQQALPQACIWF